VNAPETKPLVFQPGGASGELARRLRSAAAGEVLFDRVARAATDASTYQVSPSALPRKRTPTGARGGVDVFASCGAAAARRRQLAMRAGGRRALISITPHLNARPPP
jgi:hypothetical protein